MAKKQNQPPAAAKSPGLTAPRKSEPTSKPTQPTSREPKTYVVRGTVLAASGSPAADVTVAAFDQDVGGEDLLGDAITSKKGIFKITYRAAQFRRSNKERGGADVVVRVLGPDGGLLFESKATRNAPADLALDLQLPGARFVVRGQVRLPDGNPVADIIVHAYDQDLRSKTLLGKTHTTAAGHFEIAYTADQFRRAEKSGADLLLEAVGPKNKLLAAAPVLFNAPPNAEINLTVSAEAWPSPTLFEKIETDLTPLLEDLKIEKLEEDKEHQDLSFLSTESGLEKKDLARFVLAHRLAQPRLQAEFWFALLGGSFFQFAEGESLATQLATIQTELSSLDSAAVRKALTRAFGQKEIPAALRKKIPGWTEAFLDAAASHAVTATAQPTFLKSALDHARIKSTEKQEKFARLFGEHRAFTPELRKTLEQDDAFNAKEVDDLHASFRLADLSGGDFSVVATLKEELSVRDPEKIRALAKLSEQEWVDVAKKLPVAGGKTGAAAKALGEKLARRFREAFPTTAFAGGLERALKRDGARGLSRAQDLGRFLKQHDEFEWLNTSVDDFLQNRARPEFRKLAKDENFRLEMKAVQRVFKLAPNFEATDTLLADDLHSSQKIYRMGESEFVRSYADRPGFTEESARETWNRAADTHAAVLTFVADLKSLASGPDAVQNDTTAISEFPNWENLFKTGDQCACEPCRSVIGPAAYFADLLMFLKDRKSQKALAGGAGKVSLKDLLFRRRPDLGYLELNCDNALIPLPYIDVVCEVLEAAIAAGENDVELPGFTTVPSSWIGATLTKFKTFLVLSGRDTELSFSQVDPADPDRWVMHTEAVTYLLKKKTTPNFFLEVLRNTKASAAELRAYPQYVNGRAYEKLRAARYPLSLPFDLYAEEVRAVFQKSNLQRWDLMRTFRGAAAPNNPTEGDIAAEYFGISVPAKPADPSEKALILDEKPASSAQRIFWDVPSIPGNLPIVTVFLRKTRLEYNELLVLLDLKFINPTGDLVIRHLDASCDTDQKAVVPLDAAKLDRIHRFLRLWRKLPGWKMWELDLVIGHAKIGGGRIDERFLINLYYFCEVRARLGGNTTIEQVGALFDKLNTTTRFTTLHEKRGDALYQSLFLNKSLIHPLDPSLAVTRVDVPAPTPTTEKLTQHQPAVMAALGLKEADLELLKGLTRVSDGSPYLTDDLILTNLSTLWRQAWLAKRLKFSAADWVTLLKIVPETVPTFATLTAARTFLETTYHIDAAGLSQAQVDAILAKIFRQDLSEFASPKAALEFLEEIQHLKSSGFTADELNWLLTADPAAKAAAKTTDITRALVALRKELQAIRTEYAPARYDFLTAATNEEALAGLLATLLQKLNRDETAVADFLKILRGSVQLSVSVTGLPTAFAFPAAITAASPGGQGIPIRYSPGLLRFSGLMSDAQRMVLLDNTAIPAAVRANPNYQGAIGELYEQSLKAMNDSFSMEQEVALPAGFVFPATITGAPNAIPIRYDQRLRFTGVMTAAQSTKLLTDPALAVVTALPAYREAIQEFFNQPLLAVKFFEPVFTAPLVKQPEEVDFKAQLPDALAAKISFDPEQRQLRFNGIMTAAEKTALLGLSGDTGFVAAINSLADQPQSLTSADPRVWLTEADLDFTQLATNTYAKRLANAALKALRYLSVVSTENAVVLESSAHLGLTEAFTRRLLTEYIVVPILPAPTPPNAPKATLMAHLLGNFALDATTLNSWSWAHRVAGALKKWKLSPTTWEKIDALKTAAQLIDFLNLPLESTARNASLERFLRTSRVLKLRDSLPEADIGLLDVWGKLHTGAYATAAAASTPAVTEQHLFAADVEQLNEAWRATDLEALIGSLDLVYPNDYLRIESWERLRRAFEFLNRLNASANTAKTLAASAMTDAEAKTVKELLRSKFGAETWLTLSAEIQDALRERKRDALAAYLLTQSKPTDAPTNKWENTNDLYAYYLLDVEMSSCQLTSRLVQGSGSIQLFVQRCFMGLEPEVVVEADGANGDSAWRWWKWMRKYQVWVANRKIFLWPENWIEPELKRDRSPFFKDLENELLQNEINQDTVESAFSTYVEKLEKVAQLEIAGFFHEDDGDNAIIHAFGRTAGAEPHLYYYRRYDYRAWSPWEKVELDIQGDYLIPAVVNKRPYLFWPVFTEIPDEAGNSRMTIPQPGEKRFTPSQTAKRLRLQMAVSDFRQGKWTPKKISKDFYESEPYTCEIVPENYRFTFIDRSAGDGRVGIQFEGHSVGSLAAARKTKQYLVQVATDSITDENAARTAKTTADAVLTKAKSAVAAVKVALEFAKTLLLDANDIVATSENSIKNAGHVLGLAAPARTVTDSTITQANTAKTAVVNATAPDATADAVIDVTGFINTLNALRGRFNTVAVQAAANKGKEIVTPLAKSAQKAAATAVDAGTDALRTITTFKDNAAADAKSAGKDLIKATLITQEAIKARDNFRPDLNAHAALFGVFEISGPSGAPEKAPFIGAAAPALRPEFPSVGSGSYPSYQKWLELGTGILTRQDAPEDDFTLIKFLPPTPSSPSLNRTLFTPVLGLTPGIFRMSPSWHRSYFDSLWTDGKTGTLLPFFYHDQKRTFFVPAAIWSSNVFELSSAFGNVICHYPDIKKTVAALAGLTAADRRTLLDKLITFQWFHFKNFYHPFVRDFARILNNPLKGVPALMQRETQLKTSTFSFNQTYQPSASVLAPQAEIYHPTEQVDFTPDGAYSPYNWELFFHAPLLIANALSKNQRFEEARDWYHFIFNPIGVESPTPGGSLLSKYWITKPFFQTTDPQYVQQRIDNILRLLAGDTNATGYSAQTKKDLEDQVFDWRTHPFEPHRIASYRTVGYQKTVVMKYLDNLIAWGDNLFRQDSMESINEATQLYVLAAEILGPPPKTIPPQVKPPVASFNELENDLDKFSNALVQVENLLPLLTGKMTAGADQAPLPMLYFCIPENEKMLAYWDTIADRLYKIRHCLNIEGVARQLALFEPPIDPGALVKAVAGGVDIGSALSDLNAPLPLYRFNVLLQKANELCNDVKALGSALLAALEKKDAEAMALLRQNQEIRLLEAVKALRAKQLEEAEENLAAVKKNRELVVIRRDYYQDIEKISAGETLQQAKLEQALLAQQIAQVINIAASIAHIIPSIDMGVSGFGGTPKAAIMFGGPNVGSSLQATAGVFSVWANAENHAANKASINAGHERRWEEWKHQERLATKELEQIDRSIAAADLRVNVASKELDNQVIQIENTKASDEFMRSKYTSQELYQWQTGQISGVYFQSYKLAYDLAKRAERSFRFELGLSESSYVSFGYWDSLKKGLLSGEKLQYDLRRLEAAYLEQNRREFELTKSVSLLQLDPLTLVKLRETGRCFFRLPEEIFDLDYPGHYFRRIKSVSLTLPCVVGPYTTISCTLRLLKNSIRINTARPDGYVRNTDQGLPADDDRFVENNIPVKAIAASTAQNDSGLFELSFRDERYLPFEGAGAISEWSLELFNDTADDFGRTLRQFDYSTISDAILHVKYTAREDAGPFKNAAVTHLRDYFGPAAAGPSQRMFSLRQEFPTQWSRFLNPTNPADGNIFDVEMSGKFFRTLDQKKTLQVTTVWLLARCTNAAGNYKIVLTPPLPALPPPITLPLTPLKQYGGWHFGQKDASTLGIEVDTSAPPARWQLQMTSGAANLKKNADGKMEVEDLILVLGYHWA